jgi:predicted PurR-regulated permease PerM
MPLLWRAKVRRDLNWSMHDELQDPWRSRHLWHFQPVRDLLVVVVAAAALTAAYWLRSVVGPILVALLLAYLFDPFIEFMERRARIPRSAAILVLLAVGISLVAGLVLWLVPLLAQQASGLAQQIPRYVQTLAEQHDWDLGGYETQLRQAADRLQYDPLAVASSLWRGTSTAFGFLGGVIGTTTYSLAVTFLVPVYVFHFALHYPGAVQRLATYLPSSRREETLRVLREIHQIVSAFFRQRLFIALLMTAMFALGWSPPLTDVPYWLLLAVFTGLLSLVPYAAGLGWLLALALVFLNLLSREELTTWNWVVGLGGPTLVYGVVQFIEGWWLTPWLQGKSLGFDAVTVLIVLFLGGAAAGVMGLILAVPVAACGKILFQEVLRPRLLKWADTH